MIALFIASIVAWSRSGNDMIRNNWSASTAPTSREVAHEIFNGICIGMLSLTGFECKLTNNPFSSNPSNSYLGGTPSYISAIKSGRFPAVLRNLHYPVILLNPLAILFVFSLVPLSTITSGDNVLSVLAEVVSRTFS